MIKRVLLISIGLTIIFINTFGQGRKSLDNENGLLKFKLGSNINFYKKDIKYFWIDKQGKESYDYIKGDIKQVFGKSVKSINLIFFDDKLYNIHINFGVLSNSEQWELIEYLEKKYDLPEIVRNPDENRQLIVIWETGKVLMQLEQYNCSSPVMSCETDVFINSKAISRLLN
jgi:hypothetical protein